MATFRSTADGRFVNDQGQSLYQTYRAPVGSSGGTGDFFNSAGVGLINGAPTSPYGPAPGRPQATPSNPADLARELRDQYRQQMDAANAANEKRWQDALGLNAGLRDRMMGFTNPADNSKVPGYMDSWGAGAKLAVTQGVQNAVGDINQAAADRGIYNSSASLNRLASAGAAGGAQIANIEQQRIANQAAMDASLTNDRIGLLERKNDNAPDLNQLVQLERLVGSGTTEGMEGAPIYGGGGGGGVYGNPFVSAGQMGYSMPSSYQVYAASPLNQRGGNDMRQLSYDAKRSGFSNVADYQAFQQREQQRAATQAKTGFKGTPYAMPTPAVKNPFTAKYSLTPQQTQPGSIAMSGRGPLRSYGA